MQNLRPDTVITYMYKMIKIDHLFKYINRIIIELTAD